MKQSKKSMDKRYMWLLGMVIFGFVLVIGKLVQIQLIDYELYQNKALEQQTVDTIISPSRGKIYDRNLTVLADSATVETVLLTPVNIPADKKDLVADGLAEILAMDRETIYEKANKTNYYEVVKKKIEKDVADRVRTFIEENELNGGITLVEDTKRYYPFGNFAAQVIGFVGTDNNGLDGVEAYYDEYLTGVPGRMITTTNANGQQMPYEYETYESAQDGMSLVLTIDEVVQHYLEKYLEEARIEYGVQNGVSGIIMDVNTGEVLAMSTKGDYDPNEPFTITDQATLDKLSGLEGEEKTQATVEARQKMWRNKAVSDTYEPGSVFKIVTAASALEEGVVQPEESFYCKGYEVVADRQISCWKHGGHGAENFIEAVHQSCNPVFMEVGMRLGAETFTKYVDAFGFNETTGIDLPGEGIGITHGADMGPVELAVSSFGQTFRVTPLQLITAVSAVANGGYLVTPHVVKEIVDSEGNTVESRGTEVKRQVISEETSRIMCEILEGVVSDGTAKNGYVQGYRVAGKTGTSEKTDDRNEFGEVDKWIASFLAFAPADDPQYIMLVLLDTPTSESHSGGVLGGPIVQKVFSDILPYLGVEARYTEEELEQLEIIVPNVTGMTVDAAGAQLAGSSIEYTVEGSGDTVTQQVPEAGQKMPKTGRVILYTEESSPQDTVLVPDLNGLTPSQARQKLEAAGLILKIGGNGSEDESAYAYSQSPAAGSSVDSGSIVTVDFRYYDTVA